MPDQEGALEIIYLCLTLAPLVQSVSIKLKRKYISSVWPEIWIKGSVKSILSEGSSRWGHFNPSKSGLKI